MSRKTPMDRAILRFVEATDAAAASPDPLVATRLVSGALSRYQLDAGARGDEPSDWLWELLVALCFRADAAFGSTPTGATAYLSFTDRSGEPIDPQDVMGDPEIAGGINAMRLVVALHNQDTDTCGALLGAVLGASQEVLASTVTYLAFMPHRLRPVPVQTQRPTSWWRHLLRRRGWYR